MLKYPYVLSCWAAHAGALYDSKLGIELQAVFEDIDLTASPPIIVISNDGGEGLSEHAQKLLSVYGSPGRSQRCIMF